MVICLFVIFVCLLEFITNRNIPEVSFYVTSNLKFLYYVVIILQLTALVSIKSQFVVESVFSIVLLAVYPTCLTLHAQIAHKLEDIREWERRGVYVGIHASVTGIINCYLFSLYFIH